MINLIYNQNLIGQVSFQICPLLLLVMGHEDVRKMKDSGARAVRL